MARLARHEVLAQAGGVNVEDELDQGASDQNRRYVRREIVVQEALSAHKIEREVVSCPAEEEETGAVVQTVTGSWAPD